MKRLLSVILVAATVCAYTLMPAAAVQTAVPAKADSSTAEEKFVETDLSEYEDGELLLMTRDGEIEVKTCNNNVKLAVEIAKAAIDKDVVVAQPDYEYQPMAASNDAYSYIQWALDNDGSESLSAKLTKAIGTEATINAKKGIDINIKKAWEKYSKGDKKEVVIALIDSGVQLDHPDISSQQIWQNKDEIAGNGIDDDGNGFVDDVNGYNFYAPGESISEGTDNSHGTHNAGTMIATRNNNLGVAGVASGSYVKLMVLKTLGGARSTGKTSNIVKAIEYAEQNGADIVNLSIGTFSEDEALYRVIKESRMLFSVSAGNYSTNCDEKEMYPAAYDCDNIIAVANIGPAGELSATSNYGKRTIDIAAPGSYIFSTNINSGYCFISGTSMSAPMVAAAAALIYSYNSKLSLLDVKNIILSSAAPCSGVAGKVVTDGMLDVSAAMAMADFPFKDVKSTDSYYDAVKYLYEKGLMVGTSETAFSPGQTLNRAMVITILGRVAGAAQKDTNDFTDVQNGSWYSGYVGWAVSNNIVLGYGNGKFGPMDTVQAYQLDLMIARYAKLLGMDYSTGLKGTTYLTRGQTAEAIYRFVVAAGR